MFSVTGTEIVADTATKAHEDNRSRILETFETVPESILTINMAFDLLKPASVDKSLCTEVISMLLEDLPVLVKILLGNEPWYRKVVAHLLLRIPETSTVDQILARWKQEVVRLEKHVKRMKLEILSQFAVDLKDLSDRWETAELGIRTLFAKSQAMQNYILQSIKNDQNALLVEVRYTNNIAAGVASVAKDHLEDMRREKKEDLENLTRVKEEQMEAFRRKESELEQKESQLQQKESQLQQKESQLQQERQSIQNERAHFSKDREFYRAVHKSKHSYVQHVSPQEINHAKTENVHLSVDNATLRSRLSNNSLRQEHAHSFGSVHLLAALKVPADSSVGDMNLVMEEAESLDPAGRGKAQWLFETDEFRQWFRRDGSSLLLVDGCLEPEFVEFVSPLSAICGGLITALLEDEDSAVVFFFAGLHTDTPASEDINTGPAAMMKSLIAQLLKSPKLPPPDLGFLSEEMLEACRRGECYVLCKVFVEIVKQTPSQKTIFCIIDGISWYEHDPWQQDVYRVASVLEHLAKREDLGESGPLKVMLTSPDQSMQIGDLAMKHSDVWGYASLEAGDIHPDLGWMDSDMLS
ncbi:Acidic mammalian chitinase [Colletotrichum asianum]